MATIKKIAKELNWDVNKKYIYGIHKDYTVSLEQHINVMNNYDNYKALYIPYNKIDDETIMRMNGLIQDRKKEIRIRSFEVRSDLIIIKFLETFKTINATRLLESMDIILDIFRQLNVEPRTTCAYCGEENPDTISFINGIKLPAHNACISDAKSKVEKKKAEISSQSNPIKSYLGSLLWAVIGVLPYIVVVALAGWMIGILTIVVGYASYHGYQRFGGVVKKSTKYYLSLISFAVIILSIFGLFGYIALVNDVPFGDVLSHPDLQDILIELLIYSAVFGLIGVIYTFIRVKKDEYDTTIE